MKHEEMLLFKRFSSNLKTKDEYLFTLREFHNFTGKGIFNVTPEDIKSYIDNLGNSNTTKRKKYHHLLSFYNFLVDDLIINFNPVSAISPPAASKHIKMSRTLLFNNVKPFLDTLETCFSYRDYVITLIIATTGLKVSEATGIRWSDFIIDNNQHIGLMVGPKNNRRYVRIFNFVWEKINTYRLYLNLPESYLREDYVVFFSEKNNILYKENPGLVKPITSYWLHKVYVKACEMLDIPLITAKDIRHNYTMLCMKLGSSSEDIKEQLGWSSTDFIYRYNGVVELLDSPINKMVEEYYASLFAEK